MDSLVLVHTSQSYPPTSFLSGRRSSHITTERRVLLFIDNDKAHRAQAVQRLLAKYPGRIQLEWLPAYSPELNPQEDIWRHLRRRVTHNFYFGHLDSLVSAVHEFDQALDPEQVLHLLKSGHVLFRFN